ncbi:DnaB-like helicase N-terminal domain-containing protein, partial [Alicyclobacillus sendaiensis]
MAAEETLWREPGTEAALHMPPHSLEAEQAVLGAMLISPDAVVEALELLEPDDFYRSAHQAIYRAIREVYEAGDPVDI